MMYWRRNPFRALDDLPDRPKLGVRLLAAACACAFLRIAWPSAASTSYQHASAAFMKIEPYLPVLGNSKPTLGDLGGLLTFAGVLLMILGLFLARRA